MGWLGTNTDIVLDDAAFDKAISDFSVLASQLETLRKDITDALTALQSGFDTPAGRQFINSCKNNLLEPLDRQKLVIDHISTTLSEVKGSYAAVFTEYESLNNAIQSYQA